MPGGNKKTRMGHGAARRMALWARGRVLVIIIATMIGLLAPVQSLHALSISACGDVMIQNADGGKRLTDGELRDFMIPMKPWFAPTDVAFANLEGPIGGAEPKGCASENCHRFKQGEKTLLALKEAGINALSLANNHASDMGASGQRATRQALDAQGLRSAGHWEKPLERWMVGAKRVGLIAFTANSFAPDLREEGAIAQIREAKKTVDALIVSAHMGCEGAGCARVKGGPERYLGENRGDPMAFARAAVEAGADVVLGHGPHAPRGMEIWKGRLIAYSLGNCAVGPGISRTGMGGLAPALSIKLTGDGALESWDVGSFKNTGRALVWDEKEEALVWMMRATELDFGKGALRELLDKRQERSEARALSIKR